MYEKRAEILARESVERWSVDKGKCPLDDTCQGNCTCKLMQLCVRSWGLWVEMRCEEVRNGNSSCYEVFKMEDNQGTCYVICSLKTHLNCNADDKLGPEVHQLTVDRVSSTLIGESVARRFCGGELHSAARVSLRPDFLRVWRPPCTRRLGAQQRAQGRVVRGTRVDSHCSE